MHIMLYMLTSIKKYIALVLLKTDDAIFCVVFVKKIQLPVRVNTVFPLMFSVRKKNCPLNEGNSDS